MIELYNDIQIAGMGKTVPAVIFIRIISAWGIFQIISCVRCY